MTKAITVTEQNKALNPDYLGNHTIGAYAVLNVMPSYWKAEINGELKLYTNFASRIDLHELAGFYTVVNPLIDPSIEKVGNVLSWDSPNSQFIYNVVTLTDEEIQAKIISTSQSKKADLIQQALENQVIATVQAIEDDNEALENQDLYPLWEYPFDYTLDFKCQDFNDKNELKLYRCIQAHTSLETWQPKDNPALFTLIEFSNGIEVWSQPIGGDGKYPYLDPLTGNPYLVTHNGSTWQNNFKSGLNVWEPGAVGTEALWTLISTP